MGTQQQAALWRQMPPPPEGCRWTIDFVTATGGETVNVALLNRRGRTVRRGVVDVGVKGYAPAVEWARHVLEGTS